MNSLQVHLGTYSHVLMLAETEKNQNSLLIGRFYTTDELSVQTKKEHLICSPSLSSSSIKTDNRRIVRQNFLLIIRRFGRTTCSDG